MDITMKEQDIQLDLWAEESDAEVAAACCSGSGSSVASLSSPVSSTSTAGTAGSVC
ncbi:hypothetical protein [Allokutzneria oryzae]|uniref:Thiocillin family RiPP n=1 Tax=Allokutzneria oryzae TaxID=1378989 RepID=A0ABV5ZS31_9PSEU